MILRAPAKLNLCLYVGERREDGLHELRSLFCPLELADRIEVFEADGPADVVVCPGVSGTNLAAMALERLRADGWTGPPLRLEIDKRIPVAAGLGGGSADAAAVLRLAEGVIDVEALAIELGADVTSQVRPAFALVSGAGEVVEPLASPPALGVVLIPFERGLSARDVYSELDRQGGGRSGPELVAFEQRLRAAAADGASPLDYPELLRNDLEPAAVALMPEILDALETLRGVGADAALVAGSGPTVAGLFANTDRAEAAASSLPPRYAAATVTSFRGTGMRESAP